MYNKPWKRRASPTSCHVHKEKEMMGQTGNLATVSIPQIYITKKFKFPTENEFQIHWVKQGLQFTTPLYAVTIAKKAHPRTKFGKEVRKAKYRFEITFKF